MSSAYANWDREPDGPELAVGHKQPVSSVIDGWRTGVADMPHGSPWPIVLALCLSLMFTLLVITKFLFAAIFLVLIAFTLLAWHSQEPQES